MENIHTGEKSALKRKCSENGKWSTGFKPNIKILRSESWQVENIEVSYRPQAIVWGTIVESWLPKEKKAHHVLKAVMSHQWCLRIKLKYLNA